jgi:cyclopropane fatty-acyl-phospholipid synthase-like methyltransferase
MTADGQEHVRRMSRAYSHETWDLYDQLDRSLDPPGPDSLLDLAAEFVNPGATILDAGCRDAAYLIRLVRAHDATGVAVDPVAVHVDMARAAVVEAGLTGRIEIVHAAVETLAYPDGHFDLVWCRDVLEQVESLDAFMHQSARMLRPGCRMIAYTNLATDRLEPREARMLRRHFGNVHRNLDEGYLTAAFDRAGLVVECRDAIGTRWREYAEERTRPVSQSLLRLARLRRLRESVVATRGQDVYDHVEANLHWLLFQFLGKLEPVTYVLLKP